MEFKVGDIFDWCGIRGTVLNIEEKHQYGLYTRLENGLDYTFTLDGKLHRWHKEPTIKLIERPEVPEITKRIVKKYNVLYKRISEPYEEYEMSIYRFSSQEEFEKRHAHEPNVHFVRFVEETMIEVEE